MVASAALVSGMHLAKANNDVVRRWSPEIKEALNAPNDMVQYHALCLLYEIRKHDLLAVSKVCPRLPRSTPRCPAAALPQCATPGCHQHAPTATLKV